MRVVILCPYRLRTGGPEACHQLSDALITQGMAAEMWYLDTQDINYLLSMMRRGIHITDIDLDLEERKNDIPEYACYQTRPFLRAKAGERLIYVLPEVYVSLLPIFTGLPSFVWWLSVDNAFQALSSININFLRAPWVKHVTQSFYAAEFVKTLGLSSEMLTDYTVVPSFETDSISDRPLRVAVNAGQKVIVDLTMLELFLRNIFPDLEFVQIREMKRHEVFQTFSTSRLFIDLGSFPGRDRMAREAALLGANVIVARAGSAARHDDFPIPDCYRIAPHDIEKVAILGAHMLQFPELHSPQFESFRQKCREERVKFFGEVLQIFGPMGVLSLR